MEVVIILTSISSLLFGSLITLIIAFFKAYGAVTNLTSKVDGVMAEVTRIRNEPQPTCQYHNSTMEVVSKLVANQKVVMKHLNLE